jgi:hypothetical protein
MTRECSRADWTCPHWRLILEDHSTDGQHSRSVRCRLSKIPRAHEGLFVFALRCSHRPCGGPLKTVNIGIGGLSGRFEPSLSMYVNRCSNFGHACIICTASHVLVEIDR